MDDVPESNYRAYMDYVFLSLIVEHTCMMFPSLTIEHTWMVFLSLTIEHIRMMCLSLTIEHTWIVIGCLYSIRMSV